MKYCQMHQTKLISLLLLLLAFTPTVHAFTIDAPNFNFQATHGGNVRFANQVTSTQINVANTLRRFAALTLGGPNRGVLSFDCDTGVNMTIIAVGTDAIIYNISAVGQVDSYVYYGNRNQATPTGTNTDAITYDPVTDIVTVTTTGSVLVTLTYGATTTDLTGTGSDLITAFLLITIVSIFLYVGGSKVGISNESLLNIIIVIAFFMAVVYMMAGMGL